MGEGRSVSSFPQLQQLGSIPQPSKSQGELRCGSCCLSMESRNVNKAEKIHGGQVYWWLMNTMLWTTTLMPELLERSPITAILILLSRNIPLFPLCPFIHPWLFWGCGGGLDQALLSSRVVAVIP